MRLPLWITFRAIISESKGEGLRAVDVFAVKHISILVGARKAERDENVSTDYASVAIYGNLVGISGFG